MTTLTRKPKSMSEPQHAYAIAKAYYETQNARYVQLTKSLSADNDADNPYIDGTPANLAYVECDMDQAYDLLRAAEDNMIAWAGEQLQKGVGSRFAQVAHLFADNGRAALMAGRKRELVEICFMFKGNA